MEQQSRKIPFNLPTMLIATVLIMCLFHCIHVEAATLNPDQTVNPATGEMAFSLPLGMVRGRNNFNFPVTLNYKSGIRSDQEASPVGLGFSYGPGGITRKVAFVPDDNFGGAGNYYVDEPPDVSRSGGL